MFFGEFKPVKFSLLTNSNYDVTISLTSGRHLYIIIIFKFFYSFSKMANITAEDRILIKNLRIENSGQPNE